MLSIPRNSYSDPRKGRAKRVIAILALAAAAGAARAQTLPQTTSTTSPPSSVAEAISQRLAGLVSPPLETLSTLGDVAVDEARLLPCTVADVAGEFARLAQTGVLPMEPLACEPWVRMTIEDGFGDSASRAAKAGDGAPTVAFALSAAEAEALRASGVASGRAVPLNNAVAAVAVGPRTPGFGGSIGRTSRRVSEALGGAVDDVLSSWTGSAEQKARADRLEQEAKLVDGGRPFPAEAAYQPLALFPGAVQAKVENLAPRGAVAILTAAQPGAAVPVVPGAKEGTATTVPPPPNPVSVDLSPGAGKDPTLLVSSPSSSSSSFFGNGGAGGTGRVGGKLSPLPAEQEVVRAPVGGNGDPSLPTTVVTSGVAVGGLEAEQKDLYQG